MRLTLAVPQLLALDREVLAASRALATIAHYGGAPLVRHGTLDPFLPPSSARHASAMAPLAALGAGFDPGAHYVLRADPVSLIAGRADVTLAARIDDIDVEDCQALLATLNAHFHDDGLSFHAPRPDAWFLLLDRPPDLSTTPLSAVRGAILPWLPDGNDSKRWRRWLSEMQMLLHEHPVNAARESRGRVAVTGIWISDGGHIMDLPDAAPTTIFATRGPAGDVARGIAQRGHTVANQPPGEFAALPMRSDATVILEPANAPLDSLEAAWLQPAAAALQRGALVELTLLVDGNGVAAAWRAPRPGWMRRARARFVVPAFAPPSFGEEGA
jgi:hypothetical protein